LSYSFKVLLSPLYGQDNKQVCPFPSGSYSLNLSTAINYPKQKALLQGI